MGKDQGWPQGKLRTGINLVPRAFVVACVCTFLANRIGVAAFNRVPIAAKICVRSSLSIYITHLELADRLPIPRVHRFARSWLGQMLDFSVGMLLVTLVFSFTYLFKQCGSS